MPDIVSIGECMIELFSKEPLDEAETFQRSMAGDSLNILVAAQRLGSTTGYITRLGDDPFAQYFLRTWQKEGIDVSRVRVVDGFNAVHFVSLLPGGDREFTYYRKGSAPSTMQPSDLDPDYIGGARILHVSGISQAISAGARSTVLKAVQIAREKGISVSYDPNYRHQLWTQEEAREAMSEVLPYVDYFLPSAPSDTEAFLGTSDPREAIAIVREKGPDTVAVTCGASGAVVAVGDDVFDVPVYTPGPVMDTTGAGDAFNGAFLHGLLEGRSPRDAATLGSIAAGLKVRGRGALTTMPTGEDVYAAFDALKTSDTD
jgi:2-dehydro-3-deoxygluconokinase